VKVVRAIERVRYLTVHHPLLSSKQRRVVPPIWPHNVRPGVRRAWDQRVRGQLAFPYCRKCRGEQDNRGGTVAECRKARAIVFGFESLSTTTKHTFIIAQIHLHGLANICDLGIMKRKRSERDTQATRALTKQTRLESRYAEFSINVTGDTSLLSTKCTPPAPCCQPCAERCSRASLPLPLSPPQTRGALSPSIRLHHQNDW
jgi:hypothetical protein